MRRFNGHTGKIYSAVFHPKGHQVVSGSTDRTIKVGRGRGGRGAYECVCVGGGSDDVNLQTHTLLVLSCSRTLVFSCSRTLLLSNSPNSSNPPKSPRPHQKVWDLRKGKGGACVRTLTSSSMCNSVDVSIDGTTLISGHQDSIVRVWDLRTGARSQELRGHHTLPVTCVAFSAPTADGMGMAVSTSRDNTLQVRGASERWAQSSVCV